MSPFKITYLIDWDSLFIIGALYKNNKEEIKINDTANYTHFKILMN